MEGGDSLLPFARQFYGSPSTFLWNDEMGTVNPREEQGEGGEQGDPLMPLLFALGQHSALVAVSERLQVGELLFAFHDDMKIKYSQKREVECSHILSQELWQHCRISLKWNRKTRLWNRAGYSPEIVRSWKTLLRWLIRRQWCGRETQSLPLKPTGNQDLGSSSGKEGVCRARTRFTGNLSR